MYADLPLRIILGIVFLYHGYPKLMTAQGFKSHRQVVKSIGFRPAGFWAFCSAVAEFLGGLAVLLGGFTRIAAVLIVINMLVATYAKTTKWKVPFAGPNGYELDLTLVAAALSLALLGAGMYSLDAFYHLPYA